MKIQTKIANPKTDLRCYKYFFTDAPEDFDLKYQKRYDISVMRKEVRGGKKKSVEIKTVDYCKQMIEKHKDNNLRIYIGTDSQFGGGKAHYAIVIAFRWGYEGVNTHGVHAIYKKFSEMVIKDTGEVETGFDDEGRKKERFMVAVFERLRREKELSLSTATFLKYLHNIPIECIELDYNNKFVVEDGQKKPLYKSGRLIKEKVLGEVEGMNFEAKPKPRYDRSKKSTIEDPFYAISYADRLCRKY